MKVLCLDLATSTGWAMGTTSSMPGDVRLGTFSLRKQRHDLGLFFATYRSWLRDMIHDEKIHTVAFEAPILRGQTTISTTRKLQGLAAITEMVCTDMAVGCAEEHLQTIKKTLSLNGRAKKPQMIAAAKARGFDVADDNQADAAGLFLRVVEVTNPDHLPNFDPLFVARAAK